MVRRRRTFAEHLEAGYAYLVLSVIPRNAVLAAASRIRPDQIGKVPGAFSVETKTWHGNPDWPTFGPMTAKRADFHDKTGASMGFRMGLRGEYGIDVDIDNEQLAASFKDYAKGLIPLSLLRGVDHPDHHKFVVLLRILDAAVPLRKRVITFTGPDGKRHKIELLGRGQQFVAYGRHKDRDADYVWTTDPLDVDEIPGISVSDFERFWAGLVQWLTEEGCTDINVRRLNVTEGGSNTSGGKQGSLKEVRYLVGLIKNDKRFEAYNDWIGMLCAIIVATNRDPASLDIWESWCAQVAQDPAEKPRQVWEAEIQKPLEELRSTGIVRLREWAFQSDPEAYNNFRKTAARAAFRGDLDPDWDMRVSKPGAGGTARALPSPKSSVQIRPVASFEELVSTFVYAKVPHCFFDCCTGNSMRVEAFNLAYSKIHAQLMETPGAKRERLAEIFTKRAPERVVDNVTVWPGKPEIFEHNNQVLGNLYVPAPRPLRNYDLDHEVFTIYRDHCAYVLGNYAMADLWIGWHAYILQNPDKKPLWSIMVLTMQGIGKDLMMRPIIKAHGNYFEQVASDALRRDFNPWAAKRLLLISEYKHEATSHVAYNKIKEMIGGGEFISINQKGIPEYQVRNISALVCFSNEEVPGYMSEDDRRFQVIENRKARPKSNEYYQRLVAFLDREADMIAEHLHRMVIAPEILAKILSRPEMTAAKKRIIEASTSDVEIGLFNICNDLAKGTDGKYRPIATAKQITDWLRDEGYKVNSLLRSDILRKFGMRPVVPDARNPTNAGSVFTGKHTGARLWRLVPVWHDIDLTKAPVKLLVDLYKDGVMRPIDPDKLDEADEEPDEI